ncbi:hypothetical protein GDO81_016185 [Engystomops pustulosus]|uniref:Uncharacterized protein n=1 Tax=Engystomops pustulosus TaxID=76066 RepID=A0AAV7ARE3_ENGPU|nr:hypothetical protein GDO81_016185 [Engystomops pustulosus]KAG8563723.1 hypothetical protein GDO81_016185 [Engystomops pustulosus]
MKKSSAKKGKSDKKIKELQCTEPEESHPEERGEEHSEELKNVDPTMFDGLCDRMLSALCLLQTSVSEVLDVKDELILQNVPSCVQAQLSLSTSRLFRSLTDLYVPTTELARLVRIFGPQWEQKRQILEQLQGEHERLHRLLALALQRIQHLESQLHKDARSQQYRNWEKLFIRLMRMEPHEPSDKIQKDLEG